MQWPSQESAAEIAEQSLFFMRSQKEELCDLCVLGG
jgi:hypothetical protein